MKFVDYVKLVTKSLSKWLNLYQTGGLSRLKQFGGRGQPSKLNHHTTDIKTYFQNNPPRTSGEAQEKIEELTGIKRSPSQVREFLHREGFDYRKAGCFPGKNLDETKFNVYIPNTMTILMMFLMRLMTVLSRLL
ncbi:MAG: hypothetical protein HQM11_03635 [SAR324 cluster bacterium]|nr:hypothetical protein [SAR324 cluster bacterium]